jgi:ADP-heptose:LPS heptosyltransferase
MPGCYVAFHKQLGDLVLLEPTLSKLRDSHGAPVGCMTRGGHAPLLRLMPGVRRQRGIPLTYRSHLYCYDPLDKSAVRSFFSPAKAKSCILPGTRKMRWFHRRIFRDVIVHDLGDRYVAEYFWHHTPVASSWPFRPPRLDLPPESWKPGGLGEEPFVLVNPTAGWRQKSWLPDRWVETLGILHDEANLSFVMTNASSDWQIRHCREIEEKTGRFVRSLAGGTTLENFLWLCSRARAVLTVDGSASHLAHAFGVPSVTLFGPTNSRNWHYPTPENLIVQAPPSKDRICRMRDLPVDPVIEAARTLLQ